MAEPTSAIIQVDRPNLEVDGTITVQLTNGKHFTYRLETVKKGALEGKRIVSLLRGPDNVRDYKGFGFINDCDNIAVWKKCRTKAFDKHALLLQGDAESVVKQWLQAGKCKRCGRKLTNPESIKAGIGPDCAGKGV